MNLTVFGATGGIGRQVVTRPSTPATARRGSGVAAQ